MSRFLLVLPFAAALLAAPADEPSARAVMKKLNAGPNSIHATLKKDLMDDDPDWEGIQESTAEYVKLTTTLMKAKPPKGEAASWEMLTKQYNADARALDAAAKRKNVRLTQAAHGKLDRACAACHKEHRPKQ